MKKKSSHQNNSKAFIILGFFTLVIVTISGQVRSHPHDLLAQCQLPNGKWLMCDDTIHDLKSNAHVEESEPKNVDSFKAKPVTSVGSRLKIKATHPLRSNQ